MNNEGEAGFPDASSWSIRTAWPRIDVPTKQGKTGGLGRGMFGWA